MKVHEIVNEKIAALLAAGVAPWQKPWSGGSNGAPKNLKSKKPYRGINVFLLASSGYASPWWLTYNQAKAMGGQVRKGEKATMVVFWNFIKKEAKNAAGQDVEKSIPFLKYYNVFNTDQIDGLEGKVPESTVKKNESVAEIIEAGEAIVSGYTGAPEIKSGFAHACYYPGTDKIEIPAIGQYESGGAYYSTLFHEMGHSTGAAKRLNREILNGFGSEKYGREELCAEMTAAYLCAEAGIEGTFDQSAAYLKNWSDKIKDDQYLFISAAGKAQAAADHILGRKANDSTDEGEEA